MNFLGIGPGEILLILVVLLVVLGPERLPQFARQAARMLVSVRNWVQHSPDAALVLRARQEIDQELASIRASLMEVQSVRDEVLGAARQLENSVSSLTQPRLGLGSLINTPPPAAQPAANGQAGASAPTAGEEAPDTGDDAALSAEETPDAAPAESGALNTEDLSAPASTASAALQVDAAVEAGRTYTQLEALNLRLEAVMADLWALQEQLKQHGILSPEWQPPSFTMQLPHEASVPPETQIEEAR